MPHVLVVDDDTGIRRLVRFILAAHGFDVTEATDGANAMAVLSPVPDVIILDINMPRLNGREFFTYLETLPDRPRALVLAGHDAERVRSEIGADESLGKPFSPDDLLRKVVGLTNGRSA